MLYASCFVKYCFADKSLATIPPYSLVAKSRISRWEHEVVLEAVQSRLDRNPDKLRVGHPFRTIKSWMEAAHFQMKTQPKWRCTFWPT